MEEREFVEPVGEPLTLFLPRNVESPKGVVEGFAAHGDFRGERLLAEVHNRTAELQVFRELIVPIQADHGFALHAVVGVTLQ